MILAAIFIVAATLIYIFRWISSDVKGSLPQNRSASKLGPKVVELGNGLRFEFSLLPVPSANSVAIGDLNNDGTPDLLFACGPSAAMKVVLGAGNGNFGEATIIPTSRNAWFIKAADIDGDGNLDAVLAYYSEPAITIFWGNGRGEFPESTNIPIHAYARSVQLLDLNGDGIPDLLAAEPNNGIQIIFNNRQRRFRAADTLPHTNGVDRMVVRDLDGDGKLDIAASLGSEARETRIVFFSGNGHGSFKMRRDMIVGSAPIHLSAVDLGGDGKTQLAYVDVANNFRILCPTSAFDFRECSGGRLDSDPLLTVADLNQDGRSDLIISERSRNSLALYFSRGSASTFDEFHLPMDAPPLGVAVADLNGDGLPDLVICFPFEQYQVIAYQRKS